MGPPNDVHRQPIRAADEGETWAFHKLQPKRIARKPSLLRLRERDGVSTLPTPLLENREMGASRTDS